MIDIFQYFQPVLVVSALEVSKKGSFDTKNFFAKFEMGHFKSRFYADSEAVEKGTKIIHKKLSTKNFTNGELVHFCYFEQNFSANNISGSIFYGFSTKNLHFLC